MSQEQAEAFNEDGMQKLNDGDPAGAIECLAKAVALVPEFAQAWFIKGCCHGELEQYEDAVDCYRNSAANAG